MIKNGINYFAFSLDEKDKDKVKSMFNEMWIKNKIDTITKISGREVLEGGLQNIEDMFLNTGKVVVLLECVNLNELKSVLENNIIKNNLIDINM